MPVINSIKDNERFECKGDVTINGGIGKNAIVIITDGSLLVNGDVEERADVRLVNTQQSGAVVSGVSFFSVSSVSSVSVSVSSSSTISAQHTLQITGNLGSHAKINTQSADINIEGDIGSHARLKTKSGDIHASNAVGANARLKTKSGNIHASAVGADASLTTMSGNVKVVSADPTASLETMSGNIYEGGVKRKKTTTHDSNVYSGNVCTTSFSIQYR
ncbi:MAG: DUF4097 family beta strand repeat-containing protein [Legionella sp.]|uniref:DUF4097 family beta strand repeat-containing protein n=1 Tax=Legionella sp. TaxID=459 RepID=UPI00284B5FBA|nr:DUF4097 family beta strand repeat-containing protein [Legionella sp.]